MIYNYRMSLEVGYIIQQRYRIISSLGQGGFGAVYRAWDLNLSRPCAIKENLASATSEPTPAQRQFAREASLLAGLRHPNLPRVTDHFILPGQGQYLVMDFIDGQDLENMLIQHGGPLPVAPLLEWIGQVCDALQYLHTQDPPIIHRDVKPANIRITPLPHGASKAVLVDFGIARRLDPQARTTQGARAVTSGYSPLEQYGEGMTDARSDVYALGATLYHLLTGLVPPSSVDISAGSAPAPAPADQINPQAPAHISSAIQSAMQLNRVERLESAAHFKAALNAPLPLEKPAQKTPAPLANDQPAALAPSPGVPARRKNALRQPAPRATPPAAPIPPALPDSWIARAGGWSALLPWIGLVVALLFLIGIWLVSPEGSSSGLPARLPTNLPSQASVSTPVKVIVLHTSTPVSTPTPVATATFTPAPLPPPRIYDFAACLEKCLPDGSNALDTFPEQTSIIYLQWAYENIPTGAHYVRTWSARGRVWVQYDCTWSDASSGVDSLSLREPNGLYSTTWEITIVVDDLLLLRQSIVVAGNWTYWTPAGVFNTCHGYKEP